MSKHILTIYQILNKRKMPWENPEKQDTFLSHRETTTQMTADLSLEATAARGSETMFLRILYLDKISHRNNQKMIFSDEKKMKRIHHHQTYSFRMLKEVIQAEGKW